MNAPAISVVLAVKDETINLQYVVDDILAQTFKDFELIILDDASENKQTLELIKSFNDPRIRKVYFETHQGLAKIKNAGMKVARGRFIAMMDADDRYPHNKLQLQIEFLEKHPGIPFCGTSFNILGKAYGWQIYQNNELIRAQFMLNNPFIHPSVMFNARLAGEFQYNPEFDYAEDYEMFFRISEKHETANLPQTLTHYNTAPKTGLKKELSEKQVIYARTIREQILAARNIVLGEEEKRDFHLFAELKEGLTEDRINYMIQVILNSVAIDTEKGARKVLFSQRVLYINKWNLRCSFKNYFGYLSSSALEKKTKFKFAIQRFLGGLKTT